jgi:2-oxoisovalerate dehydrogenase E1 component
MKRIRSFEERTAELYRATEVPGFVHLSIGQEACAVGACWALDDDDVVVSNHRGHGHCLAKGLDPQSMFAELMGRESGACQGRGGSMHIADPELGIYGANGIVGAGLPIAVGAATAARLRGSGKVAVAFFGDGAVAQGAFHESVNLAAVWDLAVVFFCENNHYAEFSSALSQSRGSLEGRAAGYGVDYVRVDGNDVVSVAETMDEVLARIREKPGPVLVEAETYRWHGHYEGDPQRYRDEDEVTHWKARDPLEVLRTRLAGAGTDSAAVSAVDDEIAAEIERGVEAARRAPEPAPETLSWHVLAPRIQVVESAPPEDSEVFRTMDAVRLALIHEMAEDPSVFVAGIDVGAGGGVFGVTRGLVDQFPGRVLDTPISETALLGAAVGAAMAGMRPVVELMYMDFLGVCFDQLLNQAAKMRFMTGGRAGIPLVVRTQFGAGRSSGSQHSQSLEALLAHVPGLSVVMPSTPAETYGLLRAAIRDPNPVIFIENRSQYGWKGPRPPEEHVVPLGKARIVRRGTDITLVSWSRMLHDAVAAASIVEDEGISVEVVDLRSIVPLDRETVLSSFRRTNRMVIAHEAVRDFGVGAELAAMAVDEGFWSLDAPVIRVGAPYTPAPYAPSLERAWLPDRDTIADALRKVAAA